MTSARVRLSRRGTIALVAACGLSACGAKRDREMLISQGNTELGKRRNEAPEFSITGERLNPGLLRRFYARRGSRHVWDTREEQANSLVEAVLRAGDHGLDPDLFHAGQLRRREELAPADREFLLSDAFLSYADALARGAVPVERRKDSEALAPGTVDVPAALDKAIGSRDPGAAIEALAPATPAYNALRKALRDARANGSGGAAADRLRKI